MFYDKLSQSTIRSERASHRNHIIGYNKTLRACQLTRRYFLSKRFIHTERTDATGSLMFILGCFAKLSDWKGPKKKVLLHISIYSKDNSQHLALCASVQLYNWQPMHGSWNFQCIKLLKRSSQIESHVCICGVVYHWIVTLNLKVNCLAIWYVFSIKVTLI